MGACKSFSQSLEIHVTRAVGHTLLEVNISVLLTVIFCSTAANGRVFDVKSPGPVRKLLFYRFRSENRSVSTF